MSELSVSDYVYIGTCLAILVFAFLCVLFGLFVVFYGFSVFNTWWLNKLKKNFVNRKEDDD